MTGQTKPTVTCKNPHDIVGIVPYLLGFEPENSLVVMGINGAPTCRIDMPTTAGEFNTVREALASARVHWKPRGAVVVCYTDDTQAWERVKAHADDLLPGVVVIDTILASDCLAIPPEGTEQLEPPARSRQVFADEAAQVDDADEAASLAWGAYRKGDGARAWCFIERARTLGPNTASLDALEKALYDCVPPERL